MFPIFAVAMLTVSAIFMLISVVAIKMSSKNVQMFTKVMKTVVGLNIVVGILSIIAVVVYFL